MERPKQTMSLADFRRVIDQYVAMGGDHVSLTPIVGDPFVDRFLFERLDYLMGLDRIRSMSFFTNAILMTPDTSERLMQYAPKLRVSVSWGGFDRETWHAIMGVDKFTAARDAVLGFLEIKERRQASIPFILALRCPASNCTGQLWDTLMAYRSRGQVVIKMKGEYDSWAGAIPAEALHKVGLEPKPMPYKRGPCELLFVRPVVLADGRVNACACRDVEAQLVIGDVNRQPLSEIWAGDDITKLIERHERGDYPDVCRKCTFFAGVYESRKWKKGTGPDAEPAHWNED
jgi:radical SAM protein with 4Fe4S-binding SPASM domain